MNKRIFWVISLFYIFMTFLDCDKDISSPNFRDVILPLKIGNTWTYVDSNFIETNIDTFREEISQKGNYKSYEYFNKTYYRKHLGNPGSFSGSWLINNNLEGLVLIAEIYADADTNLINKYIVRYPEKLGVLWDSPDYNWDARRSLSTKITNNEINIQAFGKTYNCIEYTTYSKNDNMVRIDYYTVNLGCIKSVYFDDDRNVVSSTTLLECYIQ